MPVTLDHLRALAVDRTASAEPGEGLDAKSAALVAFGVRAATTCLDEDAIADAVRGATAAGVTAAELNETLALVSGLGVHALIVAAPLVLRGARGGGEASAPLDASRQALWDARIGDDPYWRTFEREVPGFLDALLRLAPDTFRAFLDASAAPWRGRAVRRVTKELISLACDATPAHRFLPGFRLHLGMALELGAGRRAILSTLDLAAACPPHVGVG